MSRVCFDRIACAKKARKAEVLSAGVLTVREMPRCGTRYQGVVDFMEMNFIYDGRKAP